MEMIAAIKLMYSVAMKNKELIGIIWAAYLADMIVALTRWDSQPFWATTVELALALVMALLFVFCMGVLSFKELNNRKVAKHRART